VRGLLDEAGLVQVAAAASGARPDDVLTTCDVAQLASVAAALETATSSRDAAARVVLEVARRRPFRRDNAAVAWLAAAVVLAGDGLRLRIGGTTAAAVVEASPRLGPAEVGEILDQHVEPCLPRGRRALRRLIGPRPLDGPGLFPCPACGRLLVQRRHDLVGSGVWADAARAERVARCAVEHGGHGRRGEPRRRDVVPA